MKRMFIMLVALTFLIVTGCSQAESTQENSMLMAGEKLHLPNGDFQEATSSIEILPSFLDNQSDIVRGIYKLAAANADLLQWMPCYCGCSMSADHQHNGNCFYKEIRDDGTIVWDDHGTRCNVCIEIAAYSIKLHEDGMSVKEIRNFIDEVYKEGYAEPTPTPMP